VSSGEVYREVANYQQHRAHHTKFSTAPSPVAIIASRRILTGGSYSISQCTTLRGTRFIFCRAANLLNHAPPAPNPSAGPAAGTSTWGDSSVSSCRSCSRAEGPGTRAGAFPMAFPSWRGSKGSSAGCQGVLGAPWVSSPGRDRRSPGWPHRTLPARAESSQAGKSANVSAGGGGC
jgi:hypothetical protein